MSEKYSVSRSLKVLGAVCFFGIQGNLGVRY